MAFPPIPGNFSITECAGPPIMKRNLTFLIASLALAALSSCTYREKETGGDSSYSTIRLFPSD